MWLVVGGRRTTDHIRHITNNPRGNPMGLEEVKQEIIGNEVKTLSEFIVNGVQDSVQTGFNFVKD
mgnify:CR=1 FL=1